MQDQINKTKLFIGMDLHKNTSTFCVKDKEKKEGSKWLRYIMVEAAHHQMNCKRIPGFGSYYNGLKKRKSSKTATVATARKLLAVVWRLFKDNRPYEVCDPRCWKSERIASKISSPEHSG